MERPHSYSTTILFLISLISSFFHSPVRAALGINYGQLGDNLLLPEKAVPLIKSIGATKVKLFDANPKILQAFSGTDIELAVMVRNEDLATVRDPNQALNWVKSNVVPFLPGTKITYIAAGNEIITTPSSAEDLIPAMQSLQAALTTLGLQQKIFVTTPHRYDVLGVSYPPSDGAFRDDLKEIMNTILSFHRDTGSPFWINAYPFYVYKDIPSQVNITYATFRPNPGVDDPVTYLHYDNMLFAQLDAVYFAMDKLGFSNIPLHLSETGWPSKGDATETGCSTENASAFNGNLIRLVSKGKGTPLRPDSPLEAYLFALFNEDLKTGPSSEKNYGLFLPDGTPSYPLTPP